ncbi:sodium:proton antiporter [Aeromicrobium sp. 636]|uniref:Cation:proton antiporter n=1 Tax=Aeromicrobium senzhongii TaxID=2663859 RepID=A0A8I0EU56_9ACTN|nr:MULTISPECIES: cation:proton antiporter [Aeromicrobium]MBC9226169.1 cation:proton antiporter [Aeromicrobium senzhongii]MCQ3998275.1 sodium:proton antiporter [Aeromicrobium sp. 636]MTB88704.1 sodium:proton antiporter [Aeromicrobium senzhongii]QNL93996.1 cation:proton antiporter [Aeromicrobium senzhongii]
MESIQIAVLVIVAITAASALAPRIGIASPLVLLAVGMVVSLLPFTPEFVIEPEFILSGLLPPLLYSTAVNMPTMDFRRDFRTISGLSVLLVVVSSLVLGGLFTLLIDGIDYPMAVALGAIVSPTDAVATSIARRLGAPSRVVTVLEGESLLNDATALVLLRTAVAATGAGVSAAGVLGDFVWAVVGAVSIGWLVGAVLLRIRARIEDAAVTTAISFTVPFLAYLPAEHLGASGLVAAVTAGLVTGHGRAKHLGPRQRLSDHQNWRTIEVLLEGVVFLAMGLEVSALVQDVEETTDGGVARAFTLAAVALVVALAIRAGYTATIVLMERRRERRSPQVREAIDRWRSQVEHSRHPRAARSRRRLRRVAADIDFYDASRFGRGEGLVLVWAGMRGVVTLAAAQTLPTETDGRSLLVLVAFFVALISLVVQGGTLSVLVRLLGLAGREQESTQEWEQLDARMLEAANEVLDDADPTDQAQLLRERVTQKAEDDAHDRDVMNRLRLQIIERQRRMLLHERSLGTFSSAALGRMLARLDADELSIDLRRGDEA